MCGFVVLRLTHAIAAQVTMIPVFVILLANEMKHVQAYDNATRTHKSLAHCFLFSIELDDVIPLSRFIYIGKFFYPLF